MAALMKSPAIEETTLLLGADTLVRESETLSVTSSIIPESLSGREATSILEHAVAHIEAEDSGVAYRRFMAEHENLLSALEDKTRAAAYELGYAEGEKAGRAAGFEQGEKQGAEQYADAVATLENLARSGKESLAKGITGAEPLIGAIVFQAVCKIVGETITTREGVQAVVEQALAEAKRQEVVSLKVSPADLGLLLEHEAGLKPALDRLRDIGLEADESIALGGCIVQLKGGHIDARIETQFRAFAQSLKDAAQEKG